MPLFFPALTYGVRLGPQELRTVREPGGGLKRLAFVDLSPGGVEGLWDCQAGPLGGLVALG